MLGKGTYRKMALVALASAITLGVPLTAVYGQVGQQVSVDGQGQGKTGSRFSVEGNISMPERPPVSMDLSPVVLYHWRSALGFGLGPSLQYAQPGEGQTGQLGYGFRAFTRATPMQKLPYLQLEYQGLSGQVAQGTDNREFISSGLLGIGHALSVGGKVKANVAIFRNMTWQGATPAHPSPWSFRVGLQAPIPLDGKDGDWTDRIKSPAYRKGYITVPPILKKLGLENSFSISPGDPMGINFSPALTVGLDSSFTLGAGPYLQYAHEKGGDKGTMAKNLGYGGRAFLRYAPRPKLPYGQLEYQGASVVGDSTAGKRQLRSAILLGAGYKVKAGKLGTLSLEVLRAVAGHAPSGQGWEVRTGFSSPLPFDDRPIPGTVPPGPQKEGLLGKLFNLEGHVGAVFGKLTQVDLSPAVAHTFLERFTVGAGPVFQYMHNKGLSAKAASWGGRAYGRFTPYQYLPFLQVEAEGINSKQDPIYRATEQRAWYTAAMAGFGVNLPIGESASYSIMALRNLNWQGPTPVRLEPWVVRVGLQL